LRLSSPSNSMAIQVASASSDSSERGDSAAMAELLSISILSPKEDISRDGDIFFRR